MNFQYTMNALAERWARLITNHPVWLLALTIAMVAGISAGVRDLSFNTDYKVFFTEENVELQAFELLNNTYARNDTILFIVKPHSGSVFEATRLDLIERLTKAAWSIPDAIRVDSLTNFQHTVATQDTVTIDDLVRDATTLSTEQISQIRAIALAEPELVNKIVAADGTATGVLVTVQYPSGDPEALMTSVLAAESMDEMFSRELPDVYIGLTGLAPISAAYPRAAQADIANLIPIVIGCVALALLFQLRTLAGAMLSLTVILMSSLVAFGFAGWIGILLTPPAVIAPIVILTIAVADCLHILMSIGKAQDGNDKKAAAYLGVKATFKPVIVTSLTTIIGFLALNMAQSPPYRDLGNMGAVGAACAMILSLTLLPSAACLLPKGWCARPTTKFASRITHWLARVTTTSPRTVVLICVGVFLTFLPFGALLSVNDHIVEYFDESMQVRRDTQLTLDSLTGTYSVEFSVDSGVEHGISNPAYLERLQNFTLWLRDQPEVVAVSSYSDTIKAMNRALHADDPAHYALPQTREEAAQYLLLYEYSLPYGQTLQDRIDIRKSATRVVAWLNGIPTADIIALKERGEEWLRHSAPDGARATAAGIAVMFSYLSHHNIDAMLWSTFGMLIMVTLTLVLFLGNVRLGLLATIPNILPPIIGFCIWGMGVGFINTAASMVTVVALGLIVDPTVHLMSHYWDARQRGNGPRQAVRQSIHMVAGPISASGLTLAIGFLLLATSSYKMNADLGLLTAVMIVVAIGLDLFLLPAILLLAVDREDATDADLAEVKNAELN